MTTQIPTPLPADALYHPCSLSDLPFETTADLPTTQEVIIGQPRAVEAIQFGIGIRHEGYNLFALGRNGVGKATAVTHFLHRTAEQQPTPDDWCYVNNFGQSHQPHHLNLPAGQAAVFAQAIKKLVGDLQTSLTAAFNSEEYQRQKNNLQHNLAQHEMRLLDEVKREAKTHNIALIHTQQGVAFAPLHEGEVVSPEEFSNLDPMNKAASSKLSTACKNTCKTCCAKCPNGI
jgi:hypothetical protein